VQEAARRIGVRWHQLEAAEEGVDLLTLRQAEKAAEAYERPLAELFLPEPPEEEPQEAQFRRLPGAPEPPWPPEMVLLNRRVRERQDAATQLYETLEEPPPWTQAVTRFRAADPRGLPALVRDVLGITVDEQRKWEDGWAALRAWRESVEALGVLVQQDGSMSLDDMRGFASVHPFVPAIVVNTKDDPRARAFTIVHELGHLLLDAHGVEVGRQTERWCNEFAGEVLMPVAAFGTAFSTSAGRSLLERVEYVARVFRVTPLAASVRIARAALVPQGDIDAVIAEIRGRGQAQGGVTGGNYYRNTIANLGPRYVRLVLTALDNQTVTYPTASTLLGGVRVNNLEKLRDQLERRSELI
jgi:Zn-dependent peptidase ImmA (M78 family)